MLGLWRSRPAGQRCTPHHGGQHFGRWRPGVDGRERGEGKGEVGKLLRPVGWPARRLAEGQVAATSFSGDRAFPAARPVPFARTTHRRYRVYRCVCALDACLWSCFSRGHNSPQGLDNASAQQQPRESLSPMAENTPQPPYTSDQWLDDFAWFLEHVWRVSAASTQQQNLERTREYFRKKYPEDAVFRCDRFATAMSYLQRNLSAFDARDILLVGKRGVSGTPFFIMALWALFHAQSETELDTPPSTSFVLEMAEKAKERFEEMKRER